MRKRDTYIAATGFLAPAVILYAAFFVFPMAQAFYIALFRWRGLSMNKDFVGLSNFRELLGNDPTFWSALSHNLTFLVMSLLIVIPVGLFVSYVLSRKVRGANAYRAVYLFPNMISVVAVAVLWSFVYHINFGLLNTFLRGIGLERYAIAWLGDPNAALPSVVVVSIWYSLGFYIVLFLAGMQSIPPSFYEAAAIDGANHLQSFRHVTIPLLWEILKLGVVYLIIHALNVFGLVYVITAGQCGPSGHTETMLTYLYRKAFTESQYGYATAIGVIAFILVLALSLVSFRVMKRETVEF